MYMYIHVMYVCIYIYNPHITYITHTYIYSIVDIHTNYNMYMYIIWLAALESQNVLDESLPCVEVISPLLSLTLTGKCHRHSQKGCARELMVTRLWWSVRFPPRKSPGDMTGDSTVFQMDKYRVWWMEGAINGALGSIFPIDSLLNGEPVGAKNRVSQPSTR